MESTIHEFPVLIYTVYGGAIIGISYDIIGFFRTGTVSHIICDTLFWIFCFLFSFTILMRANSMNFRFYTVLGFVIGFAAYYFTLGRFIRFLLEKIKNVFGIFIGTLNKLLS